MNFSDPLDQIASASSFLPFQRLRSDFAQLLAVFPCIDELCGFLPEIDTPADRDQVRHVKPLSDLLVDASDEGLAFPIAGLPGHESKAR